MAIAELCRVSERHSEPSGLWPPRSLNFVFDRSHLSAIEKRSVQNHSQYHLNGWNSVSGIILYLYRWGSESWKHHSDMLGPHNYGKAVIVLGGQIWVVSGGASEYLSVSI